MDWKAWLKNVLHTFDKEPERSLKGFRRALADHVTTNVYIQLVVNMNEDKSTTYGTRVQGSVNIQGNLTDSFNTINNFGAADPAQQDLSARLKKLHEEVGQLIKVLPAEEAEQASRDLKLLVDESTSKKPRKPIYEVSADGLLAAAKSVASLTAPITTAVKAVLALLTI